MEFEIDQSGKVESTRTNTVLALTNGTQYTIFVSGAEKRKVFAQLRTKRPNWQKKQSFLTVFSILAFLLIKDSIRSNTYITIDTEYFKQDFFIKDQIMRLCRKHGIHLRRDQIVFHQIGKKSQAHYVAITVFRGKRKPSRIIEANDILAEV